jgi:FkbM family methyltransferase
MGRKAWKALHLLRDPLWRRGLRSGVAATVEHQSLPLRDDYRTVIDVGANRGQFALFALSRFPRARVYCVEPLSRPRARLSKLLGGDPRVQVFASAAGAAAGRARINVSREDDSSSLLEISARQTEMFPGTAKASEEDVAVATLDELLAGEPLEAPLLLKLDVQGYELEALRGAEETLRRADSVLVECSFVEFYGGQALFGDVAAFLAERGFSLVGGEVTARDGRRWLQGDFVWQRQVQTGS